MAQRLYERFIGKLPEDVKNKFDDLASLPEGVLKAVFKAQLSSDVDMKAFGIPEARIHEVRNAIKIALSAEDLTKPTAGVVEKEAIVHILTAEDLKVIHTEAIRLGLGLASIRNVLLGGIDSTYVSRLPIAPTPSQQLESDLVHLNATTSSEGDIDPLTTWLTVAHYLSRIYPGSDIFLTALRKRNPQAAVSVQKPAAPISAAARDQRPAASPTAAVPIQRPAAPTLSNLSPIPAPTAIEEELMEDLRKITPTQIHKPGNELPHDLISELMNTLLSYDRSELLSGISNPFVASLQKSAFPNAQLLSDLHNLNRVKVLLDRSDPFAIYLLNALRLSLKDSQKYHTLRLALRARQSV